MAAAAAPGAGGNAGKYDDGVPRRRVSRAELVKRWEDVFDNVGGEKAMELFMTLLLRDARAEYAQQSRKEEDDEEEERRARVFEPWQPAPPGSSAPPPPPRVERQVVLGLRAPPPPRVERQVVLGLRAPPHLLPRREHERRTTPPPPAPAADLARPANNTRGGV